MSLAVHFVSLAILLVLALSSPMAALSQSLQPKPRISFVPSLPTVSHAGSSNGLAASPWPMFMHDPQHTGRSQYLGAQTNEKKWEIRTTQPIRESSTAIGSDGTIYVRSLVYLYAFKPDGTKKWAFQTPCDVSSCAESSPAIASDGSIYIGTALAGGDGYLYAINPDGTQKWKFVAGGIRSSPAIGSDGTIYVGSDDGYLYAINRDGSPKWEFKVAVAPFIALSSPAISSDGTIYIGSYNSPLYAINRDGSLKWKFGAYGFGLSPAIHSEGTIFVASVDGDLYAINPDGSEKWKFQIGGWTRSSPAIGSDGTTYIGSGDHRIYGIKPDGTQKWSFETKDSVNSSPAIGSDNTIYIGSDDNYLYAISSDGTLKWKFGADGDVRASPAIGSDGTVYVGVEVPSDVFEAGRFYAIGASAVQTNTVSEQRTTTVQVLTTTPEQTATTETVTTSKPKQTTSTAQAAVVSSVTSTVFGGPAGMLSTALVWALCGAIATVFALVFWRWRKTKQARSRPALLICPRCGTQLPHDSSFCDNCGIRIHRR